MRTYKILFKILLPAFLGVIVLSGCDSATQVYPELPPMRFADGETFTKANDGKLSAQKKQNYRKIAEKMAINYVNEQNPEQTNIPGEVVSFFYNGLVHLYNSDLKEAQVITGEYVMIKKSPARSREVLLWTSKSKPWVDNWRAGKTKTGIAEIDKLIDEFDLSLQTYRELSVIKPDAMAKMQSDQPINVYAVGKLFDNLQEIEKAAPDVLLTGGRDVKATVNSDYLLFDITVGSGDCPSGCINRINHQFRIFPGGSVKLVD